MASRLDLKALGYGLATFVVGSGILAILGQWIAGQAFVALAVLIPVASGYMSAFYAPSRRLMHGTVGGSIGVLLVLGLLVLIPGPALPIPATVVLYLVLACAGAFIGDFTRNRAGA
jgi:hypothetical protein